MVSLLRTGRRGVKAAPFLYCLKPSAIRISEAGFIGFL